MTEEVIVKKKPGGWPKGKPRKIREEVREQVREAIRSPNRDFVYTPGDDEEILKIPKELIPDGMDYQWVRASIYGQPDHTNIARFQKKGWTPVQAERHPGRWMPKGYSGVVEVSGLILHERPLEYSIKYRQWALKQAHDQRRIKEAQLRGGDIPGIAFDTQHPTVRNQIRSEYERLTIPEE